MKSCFLCEAPEKKLIREFSELLGDPHCQLSLCERCEPELKPRKYQLCKQCSRQFREHDWRSPWLRFYNTEIKLRGQLRDRLTVKPDFFKDEGEMQHFYLLIELLVDCRRTDSKNELELRLRNSIDEFIDKKRMALGIEKLAGQSQQLDYPKFIRKVENPGNWGANASGYDLELCYQRGLDMLRRRLLDSH